MRNTKRITSGTTTINKQTYVAKVENVPPVVVVVKHKFDLVPFGVPIRRSQKSRLVHVKTKVFTAGTAGEFTIDKVPGVGTRKRGGATTAGLIDRRF
jgi:hypothetical protein